ncbi:uncharacterized protein PV09_05709 [Verruconis gallopava]|uniref:Uncharacterized protein n=1 Tax=Verruconis gallopava TaxID=253628 RepID=A0A0D2A945_9PEZI|nr:uncharacterized protein PV09_05709 [Verruconis gallopava]KIW03060.1 hypothetical protein PV09_05709 [Verruconis gallopava]
MPSQPGSSAIAIPKRKRKQHFRNDSHGERPEPQAAESPAISESMMSSSSARSSYDCGATSPRSLGKSPVGTGSSAVAATVPSPVSLTQTDRARRRTSSFLSESLAKSEYTIVDIGSEDSPRLITCIKTSQGFDWNQELFLPSYLDHEFEPLERRQEPVKDIVLTDEEAAAFLPQ